VAVSHASAALLWGLPLTERPDRVHGSRTGAGQFRRATTYTIHTGYAAARTGRARGARVVEPAFAVVGVLEQMGVRQAVVAGDGGLHRGQLTMGDLERAASSAGHPSTRRRMERAMSLMDAACESPGESLSRLLLRSLGFPVTSQVEVRTPGGSLLGRLDFLIDGTRVAVEFDGLVKYGERTALINEKRRELALQRAGYIVVRLVWSDLSRPDRVRQLIEDAIAVDRARSA
jgi:very-short-patch-repair endonuclease